MLKRVLIAICLVSCWTVTFAEGGDILIADFEGQDYGTWRAEGKAFGKGPAKGTLPNQMKVYGFRGEGLVNSYWGGDGNTGLLTSSPFKIERAFINFLIGGGKYPGKTCMKLIVEDEIVRTATGPNDHPGGTERLSWNHWDVTPWMDKMAHLEIVDQRTGGWGHINVDHIFQSGQAYTGERRMTILAEKRFLNLPVKNGACMRRMRLLRGEAILREFEIELAENETDFWVVLDLSSFQGEELILWVEDLEQESDVLERLTQADEIIGGEDLYQEKYRPQFHFTSKRGWNNDPNGLVYYGGEYHLFWQHNPYGWKWGNMTWGHAVSEDLVHWTELGDAIHPDQYGTIFSGSAVVDDRNTTGFQAGKEKPIVCVYTYAGGTNLWSQGKPFTQGIAYSLDRGRSWTKYEGNPVQGHINGSNRDPKALWHDDSNQWVIVLYLDDHRMGIFTSKDLQSWEFQSELNCFHECPELFEIVSDTGEKKWILYGASGDYFVGTFDGKTYQPETASLPFQSGNCFYASQTFNHIPEEDGRRIQIAWGRAGHPDMPFNQMMNFPVELSLKKTEDGLRLFAEPVREIQLLHGEKREWNEVALKDKSKALKGLSGDCLHIQVDMELGDSEEVGLTIRGIPVTYDVPNRLLRCQDKSAKLPPSQNAIHLEILVDRLSMELFGGKGRVYMPMALHFDDEARDVELFAKKGKALFKQIQIWTLQSAWLKE